MAYQLTEENIKHATLSFLKTYYKNNSSRGFGETIATLNMQAGDGIIADGYIKFSVDEDPISKLSGKEAEEALLAESQNKPRKKSTFLATFEATSQATAQEIQYSVQSGLLILDALAIASMVAAGSYGYNYMNDQYTLNQLGTFKFFAGFVGVLIATMIAYMLLFRRLSRYHHIHALAQFKRYHADEQWVAYGEDVFANPGNKYLIELKKQCIRHGFGLISVDQNLQPSLVMTPARDLKKNNHIQVKSFKSNKLKDNKAFKWANGIKVPNLKSPIDTSDYTRFTKSYWKQGLVILAMTFVIGDIYYEEHKNPNIIYADEKAYQKELAERAKNSKEEPVDYLVENEEGDLVLNSELKEESIESVTITPKKKNKPSKTIASRPKTSKQDALIIATGMEEYVSYDCRRLAAVKGTNYLVQIATANNSTEAIKKVKSFNENGFRANAVWLGCFLNKKNYVVYLDDIYHNKNAATLRLEKYQKLLIAKKQSPKNAVLRAIVGK